MVCLRVRLFLDFNLLLTGRQVPIRCHSPRSPGRRMNTSRASLDRLLDPENESVTLNTLSKAAMAVGRELRFELV